jgi:lysyl-tRNA synthetase class 2
MSESTDITTEQAGGAEDIHRLEAQRRENLAKVAALGVRPYGERTDGLVSLAQARALYDAQADADHQAKKNEPGYTDRRPVVRVAGRVMLHRDNGKLIWLQLRDHSVDGLESHGDLQVAVSKKDCDETGFDLAKVIDLGDIVVAEGPLMKTRTGEVTIWASRLAMGAKSLAPPPEKWSGLQDKEVRYRKRYIDLYANPDAMRVAKMRPQIISRIRRFLDERGFLEVETPVLQPQAGGAAARPFLSHLNALDMPVVMRIATELHLKRLMVGGMPRVYEIGRIFRNEGVDRSHNPEFTSVEVYEAFGDSGTMMELTESLIRELAHWVAVTTADPDVETEDIDPAQVRLPYGDLSIDYGAPFRRVSYAELFESALGFPMTDAARAREVAKQKGLKHEGLADILVVNEVFEAVAEATLDPQQPTFVTDYPAALSPLTRPDPDNPAVAQRWDLFIAGMEIGPAYTELNDPDIQAEKFREQFQGMDEEENAFRAFDEDFIEALKVGMPPAGGLGLGIDRLVMLLTNQQSIRDVILFPFMRPV